MTPTTSPAAAEDLVVCVVVTRDRPELLSRCLAAVATQQRRPDLVLVVDNSDDESARAVVEAARLPTTYLPARRNLGGAGGFAYGVLAALAAGADWVWLADDDGCPGDEWTLSRLLVCADEHGLDVVSPLVLDDADPTRLAFPLRRGLTWVRDRDDLRASTVVPGRANLFNGTLLSARGVHAVGLPDVRLFVRGDEVDVHRRIRRSGVGFATCPAATYLHPQGHDDWQPILGGRLQVLVPADPQRRAVTFRNLGYLTGQAGLRWRRLPDAVRYAWWFGVVRRDLAGLRECRRLVRAGRAERFGATPGDLTVPARRAPSVSVCR